MYNGKMETIYESEYMNLYDLQYREGGHYYCASRRNKDRMVALTPDEECGTMQPDAVSCFVVLNIKGQPKKLLLNWEYRYPVGQYMLSVPAGLIDKGDWNNPNALVDTAIRELTDETGIEVVVNEVGWDDIREKLATPASGGQAVADVVEVDWSWVGEFYAADWLEPLEVSEEDKADMPTLETFTKEDKVLAIPYANDYRLSYYNTEQFKAAGVTEEPQTWDDVLEACRKLKSTGTVDYPFAIALNAEEKTSTCLMWLAYAMNGVVWNEDGTLNEESVMEALKYMETLDY